MITQPTTQDRILADFRALARGATPELAALYQYDYVVQNVNVAANTIDALPFDRAAGLPPLQNVPIRTGIPGATVQPALDSRLAIGFLDADFTKYVVCGWYDSTQATQVNIDALTVNLAGGSFFLARGDWSVALTGILQSFAGALGSATNIGQVAAAGSALATALSDPTFPAPNTTRTLAT
jgi:hypothetical protein